VPRLIPSQSIRPLRQLRHQAGGPSPTSSSRKRSARQVPIVPTTSRDLEVLRSNSSGRRVGRPAQPGVRYLRQYRALPRQSQLQVLQNLSFLARSSLARGLHCPLLQLPTMPSTVTTASSQLFQRMTRGVIAFRLTKSMKRKQFKPLLKNLQIPSQLSSKNQATMSLHRPGTIRGSRPQFHTACKIRLAIHSLSKSRNTVWVDKSLRNARRLSRHIWTNFQVREQWRNVARPKR